MALQLLGAADTLATQIHPAQQPSMTNGQVVVVGLLTQCVRLVRSIHGLLTNGYPEEAEILLRTLMEASTVLAYLHRHSNMLEALALRLIRNSLQQELGLEQEATAVGLKRPQDRIQRVNADMVKVERLSRDLGLNRLPAIPAVNAMLQELDARKLYWFHKRAGHQVHSSTLGLAQLLIWDEERMAVKMAGEPRAAARVAYLATESFLTALLAAAHLLAWTSVDQIARFRDQIRPAFNEIVRRLAGEGLANQGNETPPPDTPVRR